MPRFGSKPLFGTSVARKEDQRFVTGHGQYTDDVTLPGQTWAAFVRSPYAHAKILSVDTSDAETAPGVIGVLTGADYVAAGLGPLICGWGGKNRDGSDQLAGLHLPLAPDVVRYVGDHVAVVIAETKALAKDAAELVAVDYEELPANVDPRRATDDDVAQLHEAAPRNRVIDWELGNANETRAAFESAAHVVELDLYNNRVAPNAMETRCCNAAYDPGTGEFTLYLASQHPFGQRTLLSAVVGFAPENKIRVISPDVGGGFGSKAFQYAEDVVCMWACREFGRPVKWMGERGEAFLSDAHGREHYSTVRLALDSEHRFTGLHVKTTANLGAYLSTFGTLIPTYMYGMLLSGVYRIPAIHAEVLGVYTNTAPLDAYRGAGRPEAAYAVERIVDKAARELGVDPAELRRKNFIRDFPYQTPLVVEYDIGDFDAELDRALEMIAYDRFGERRKEAAGRGKLRGIGLSVYTEACGFGPSQLLGTIGAGGGAWESAEIRVLPTAMVEVVTGCHSHGQSHETTFAQLVASRFGVPIDHVTVLHGDTKTAQQGMGTYGSRAPVGLEAIDRACTKILDKGRRIAGYLLEASADDIEFDEDAFKVVGTDRQLSFAEVAGAAHAGHSFPTDEIEPGLHESAFFDPQNFTYPSGCYVCEVEIDPETGVVEIADFVAVDDFGNVANPQIVDGQVHGGVVQGIGQALMEHAVYDPDSGQLVTGSYMDYRMPRAADLPEFRTDRTVTESTSNTLGMKGCGEAGAIGAPPAVVNAVIDALGVDSLDMPLTPEAVWRACQDSPRYAEIR